MKQICVILALVLLLTGCGAAAPAPDPAPTTTPKPKPVFFDTDEVVDRFLIDYNAVAEFPVPAEEVERGNIKTKALVYMEDLSFEVIHAPEFLSLSFSAEEAKLRAVFRDVIAAVRPEISAEDVGAAWDAIHATGYMVEGFALADITITYVPTKARIDMKIPLNGEA